MHDALRFTSDVIDKRHYSDVIFTVDFDVIRNGTTIISKHLRNGHVAPEMVAKDKYLLKCFKNYIIVHDGAIFWPKFIYGKSCSGYATESMFIQKLRKVVKFIDFFPNKNTKREYETVWKLGSLCSEL